MEFSDYVNTIRRHAAAIIALVLIGACVGFLYSRTSPALYMADSSVFVSTNRGENTSDLVQGSVYTQNLMQSYAKLAVTPSVLGPVIDKLDLDLTEAQLEQKVSADAPLNTVIIVVTVTDESPVQAAAIANAVTEGMSKVAQELSPKKADGTPGISLSQVGRATPPANPYAPNTNLLVVAGAGLSLLLALGLVVVRHLMERRIHSVTDLKAATPVPILGQLPALSRRAMRGPGRMGVSKDAFLRLADRVTNASESKPLRSVVVTSAGDSDGKTHTAIKLALAAAEFHGRVLLVDAHLRSPEVAGLIGLPQEAGLSDALEYDMPIEDVIVSWQGIWVLPAGTVSTNSTRLLNSPDMAEVFLELIRGFDFIVCDSAPVLGVADSLPLTRLTDGSVIIARVGRTKRAQLVGAVDTVGAAGGQLTGIVLNGVRQRYLQRLSGLVRKKPKRMQERSVGARSPQAKRSDVVGTGDRHS